MLSFYVVTYLADCKFTQNEMKRKIWHICVFVEQALLDKSRFCENLVEFIRVINVNIRDLQLDIRRAVDEFTGDYYYVLVCWSLCCFALVWF